MLGPGHFDLPLTLISFFLFISSPNLRGRSVARHQILTHVWWVTRTHKTRSEIWILEARLKNWRPRNIKLCPISDKGDGTLRKALWLRVGEEKGWRRHWFRTTSRLGGEYLPNELNKIGPIVERKTALPGEISSARAYLILWTLVNK